MFDIFEKQEKSSILDSLARISGWRLKRAQNMMNLSRHQIIKNEHITNRIGFSYCKDERYFTSRGRTQPSFSLTRSQRVTLPKRGHVLLKMARKKQADTEGSLDRAGYEKADLVSKLVTRCVSLPRRLQYVLRYCQSEETLQSSSKYLYFRCTNTRLCL